MSFLEYHIKTAKNGQRAYFIYTNEHTSHRSAYMYTTQNQNKNKEGIIRYN